MYNITQSQDIQDIDVLNRIARDIGIVTLDEFISNSTCENGRTLKNNDELRIEWMDLVFKNLRDKVVKNKDKGKVG
jgi:hypothetical protein